MTSGEGAEDSSQRGVQLKAEDSHLPRHLRDEHLALGVPERYTHRTPLFVNVGSSSSLPSTLGSSALQPDLSKMQI